MSAEQVRCGWWESATDTRCTEVAVRPPDGRLGLWRCDRHATLAESDAEFAARMRDDERHADHGMEGPL